MSAKRSIGDKAKLARQGNLGERPNPSQLAQSDGYPNRLVVNDMNLSTDESIPHSLPLGSTQDQVEKPRGLQHQDLSHDGGLRRWHRALLESPHGLASAPQQRSACAAKIRGGPRQAAPSGLLAVLGRG